MRMTFWIKEKPINIVKELRLLVKKTKKSMSAIVCEAIIKYKEEKR